jgi:hypothetical protein
MALNTNGATPATRRIIIDKMLNLYTSEQMIQGWRFDKPQAGMWSSDTQGVMLIYGLMQIEAFIAGIQSFAVRLGYGPLSLARRTRLRQVRGGVLHQRHEGCHVGDGVRRTQDQVRRPRGR